MSLDVGVAVGVGIVGTRSRVGVGAEVATSLGCLVGGIAQRSSQLSLPHLCVQ